MVGSGTHITCERLLRFAATEDFLILLEGESLSLRCRTTTRRLHDNLPLAEKNAFDFMSFKLAMGRTLLGHRNWPDFLANSSRLVSSAANFNSILCFFVLSKPECYDWAKRNMDLDLFKSGDLNSDIFDHILREGSKEELPQRLKDLRTLALERLSAFGKWCVPVIQISEGVTPDSELEQGEPLFLFSFWLLPHPIFAAALTTSHHLCTSRAPRRVELAKEM